MTLDLDSLQELPEDQGDFERMQSETKDIQKKTRTANKQRSTRIPFFHGNEEKPKPKSRGRAATVARQKADITQKIKAWLLLSNTLIELHPALARDALDEIEIEKAAEALNALAMRNNMLYSALTTVVSGSGMYEAILVLGIIGGRRLARHGIIPEVLDPVGGALLSMDMEELGTMLPGMGDETDSEPSATAG